MNIQNRNSEKGSAIIWILVAVGLFAALNFAFNSSSRTSTSVLDDAEAGTYAKQIIQYGNEVKASVKRLQLRGCDDTEISFENSISGSNYTNPNAPTSNKCHVFNTAGGGLTFKILPEGAFVESPFNNREPQFKGTRAIEGAGTNAGDLHYMVHDLKLAVCLKINDLLSVTNPAGIPPEDGNDVDTIFIGTYGTGGGNEIGDDVGSGLEGQKAFCRDSDDSADVFYQYIGVLLAR